MNQVRKFRRVRTTIPCGWGASEDAPRNGIVTSLSINGCFVQTKAGISEGQAVHVNCWLPTERWLRLRGYINYHLPQVGFGLLFADFTPGELEAVNLLLDYYEDGNTVELG